MQIQKILNNNVVVALDEQGAETVLMGRGLGFGRKTGDPVNQAAVEKRFTLHSEQLSDKFQQLMTSIPMPHFLMSERIINHAKIALGKTLSDSIYVTLPDHISAAITRYKDGIRLPNPLLWDIRQFYPDEFSVGLKANEIVLEETGVQFTEDEAGFIAMHFVNAQIDGEIREVYDMTYLMQEVFQIVRREFGYEPDRDSINYYRFVTHLKFFAQRIMNGQRYGNGEEDLLAVVRYKYPKAYECARQVCAYVRRDKGFDAGQNELLYLTIHIARITEDCDSN
ncbi:BglG family transcription antiterminator LicT [Butyricicoccus sp. Marseille-Q5471]|uniref:BglG family transcription antiterminator LicT n=1 Tax=Butyricicoccus sp. Marseille-Q5471 TaxID=3039493 RepID=UPI0024BC30FD|nr:PRD domain-containing protein [Butyricicoccus sp. Marseille-Q5471]